MEWIKKLTGGYSSSAKVVDGTLIISLPDAISPVVWRMDFGHAKSSAIEVRDNDGHYVLILKTPKGDVNDIAPFDSKSKAVNALMAVSKAMEHGQGQIRPVAVQVAQAVETKGEAATAEQVVANVNMTQAAPKSAKNQTLAGIIGVLVLVGLIAFLFKLSTASYEYGAGSDSARTQASTSMGEDTEQVGVSVSADSFLRGRN